MLSSIRGRDRFTRLGAHSAAACWVVFALSACGDDGAAPPEGAVQLDAEAVDAAQPQPVDAAVPPPNASSSVRATGSEPGISPLPTMISTATGVTAITSSTVLPVPSLMVPSMGLPAPSMSASSGPVWVPVESPLDGQTDCRERVARTDSSASFELDCDPGRIWASCTLESLEVECKCQNKTTYEVRGYRLPVDTDVEVAARAGAALCIGENAPEFIASDCEEMRDSTDTSCAVGQLCVRTVELGDGLEALMDTPLPQVSCFAPGVGGSSCHCADPDRELSVYGVDIADTCDLLAPWCASERVVEEEITCSEASTYLDAFSCTFNRECGGRAALDGAGDVLALSVSYSQDSFCTLVGDNISSCVCGPNNGASISGIIDTGVEEACARIDEMCEAGLPIQATGAIECNSPNIQTGGGQCTGSEYCAQPFSVGAGALRAGAYFHAACDTDGNGGWSCVCSGGGADTQPETLTAPTVIQACVNALDSCATRAHLELVESGDFAVMFSDLPGPSDAGVPVAPVDATVLGQP